MSYFINASIVNYSLYVYILSNQKNQFLLPTTVNFTLYRQGEPFLHNFFELSPGVSLSFLSCASFISRNYELCNNLFKQSTYSDYRLEGIFEGEQKQTKQFEYNFQPDDFIQNLTVDCRIYNGQQLQFSLKSIIPIKNYSYNVSVQCFSRYGSIEIPSIFSLSSNGVILVQAECSYFLNIIQSYQQKHQIDILHKCTAAILYEYSFCGVQIFNETTRAVFENGIAIKNRQNFIKKDKILKLLMQGLSAVTFITYSFIEIYCCIRKKKSNRLTK